MYQKFYGMTLAEGSFIQNLRVENINDLDGIPDNITSSGRIWFNVNLQKLQYTYFNATNQLSVETINRSGWKDLLGSFATAKTGTAVAPVWADMGFGFYAWRFDNGKDTGLQVQYHTTHCIDYTKKAMLHIHWIPTTNTIGNVVFKVNYIIAKGHGQGERLNVAATGSFLLIAPTKGIIGEHTVTEQLQINGINLIEPDCLIICNVSRQGTHAQDTYSGAIYGFTADWHYWSEGGSTLGNKPSFDTLVLPTSI